MKIIKLGLWVFLGALAANASWAATQTVKAPSEGEFPAEEVPPVTFFRVIHERGTSFSHEGVEESAADSVKPSKGLHIYPFKSRDLQQYFQDYKPGELSPVRLATATRQFGQFANGRTHHNYYSKAAYEVAKATLSDSPTISGFFAHIAATMGHPEALYDLSVAFKSAPYYFGLDKVDQKIAKLLCEAAADFGNPDAAYSLAAAHFDGSYGVEKDEKAGRQKLQELADHGNTLAKRALESLDDTSEETLEELSD